MKTLRISPPAWVAIMTVAIVALVFAMLYPALLAAAGPHEDAAPPHAEGQTRITTKVGEHSQPMPTRFAPRRNAASPSASILNAWRKSTTS